MEELVAIARIVKPRGLRGEVVADLLTDFPERFEGLEQVVGVSADGERTDLKIEDLWFQKDRVIFRFADYGSIERAETLRGVEICVPESDAVELEDDQYYDWQLEGCSVVTVDGDEVGVVAEVMRTGGTENLLVKGPTGEYLIPFAGTICTVVNIAEKKIVVDLPEGLLEF